MSLSKPFKTSTLVVTVVGLVALMLPAFALAEKIGVGVGTGKIELNEALKPGMTYYLPAIPVFNNGDVASDYKMSIQLNEKQDELKPDPTWFTFSPATFYLEPGKSTPVNVTLKTSSKARAGKYFAYIEAQPTKNTQQGDATINVAAATKMYFEVKPANWWQELLYVIQDFWNQNKEGLRAALIAVITAIVFLFFRKYFRIERRPATAKEE
jgi:hypothetical protein